MLLLLCLRSMSVLLHFFIIWRKLDDQEHAIQINAFVKLMEK